MMRPMMRPMMRGLALRAVAALAVAALAGCGGSDDGKPPAANPAPPAAGTTATPAPEATQAPQGPTLDACAIVSKKDAEQLAGTPLEDAVPARESCTYTGPVTGPTAQVEIYVGDGAKKILDVDKGLGHELKALTGIGDEAYLEEGSVFVAKSGVWVAIRLVRLDDPAIYNKRLEDLARTVAGRI